MDDSSGSGLKSIYLYIRVFGIVVDKSRAVPRYCCVHVPFADAVSGKHLRVYPPCPHAVDASRLGPFPHQIQQLL